ncbi:hypothetical protein D3C75_636370 [compost metagenome]
MGSVGQGLFGAGLRTRPVARQAFPELDELLVQLGIVQIAETLARDHHDIQTGEHLLMQTEGIADEALQAIALDGKLDALLADHQAEARMIEAVFTGQQ